MEVYLHQSDTCKKLSSLKVERKGPSSCSFGGKIWIFGGRDAADSHVIDWFDAER